jgi:hypothetical protein
MEQRKLEEYIETYGQSMTNFYLQPTRPHLDAADLFQKI